MRDTRCQPRLAPKSFLRSSLPLFALPQRQRNVVTKRRIPRLFSVSGRYLGNVVDLWERLAAEEKLLVDLGSDQTSCHNPFNGGYYPAGLTVDESKAMMRDDPPAFKVRMCAYVCACVFCLGGGVAA